MKVDQRVNGTNLQNVGLQAKAPSEKDMEKFSSILSDVSFKTSFVNNESSKTRDDLDIGLTRADKDEYSLDDKMIHPKNQREDETKTSTRETEETSISRDESEIQETQNDTKEEEQKKIEAVLSTLFENISEILGVSMEDLKEALSDLNMDVQDLLQGDGMKELFFKLESVTAMDLLTNEGLNNELGQVMQAVEDALQSLESVDLSDEFETVFSEWMTEDEIGNLPDENVKEDVFKEDVQTDTAKESEPVVLVENHKTDSESNRKQSLPENTEHTDDVKLSADKQEVESEHPTEFANTILQDVQEAFRQVEDLSLVDGTSNVDSSEILNQIVERIKVTMNQDSTSLQMQLYPEHLGKIQINVVSKDGIMTARIVAENEAAKQVIENGLTSLKEAMEHQNIKVEAIEVMVSTTGFENGQEQNASQEDVSQSKFRRKGSDLNRNDEESAVDELAESQRMAITGSSVSYSA